MSAFICEEGHTVAYPSDRIIVSLDLMTADGKRRLRRVQLRRMCKRHALEWVMRLDPERQGEQLRFGDQTEAQG